MIVKLNTVSVDDSSVRSVRAAMWETSNIADDLSRSGSPDPRYASWSDETREKAANDYDFLCRFVLPEAEQAEYMADCSA